LIKGVHLTNLEEKETVR